MHNIRLSLAVDIVAINQRVKKGELSVAFDADHPDLVKVLGRVVASNGSTAFNTREANTAISDRVTASIINLLSLGNDSDVVNPDFMKFRKHISPSIHRKSK